MLRFNATSFLPFCFKAMNAVCFFVRWLVARGINRDSYRSNDQEVVLLISCNSRVQCNMHTRSLSVNRDFPNLRLVALRKEKEQGLISRYIIKQKGLVVVDKCLNPSLFVTQGRTQSYMIRIRKRKREQEFKC